MYRVNILILFLMLTSCISHDVTNQYYAKKIVGQCFEFVEEGLLLRKKGGDKVSVVSLSSNYLFVTGKEEYVNRTRMSSTSIVSRLPIGSKIKMTKLVDYPYGSAGRCWVLKAKLLSNKVSELVEVPSCWVWDNPIWLFPDSPSDLQGQYLSMTTSVIKPSSC